MAWRCSGASQQELVEHLVAADILHSPRVASVMKNVDRGNYVLPGSSPYEDAPQAIGYGQTISAPHMHAHALDMVAPLLQPGSKVLDVGSGSGYLTACFARLVQPQGRAIGIESIPELVKFSKQNVLKQDGDLVDHDQISFFVADGWKGLQSESPFDIIHVGAAATKVPTALMHQLNSNGGKLIIPIGPTYGPQELMEITRHGDSFDQSGKMGVRYVPLVQHPF